MKDKFNEIVDFIHSRKKLLHLEAFDYLRQKKYNLNMKMVIGMKGFASITIFAYYTFPVIEFAYQNTYRFPTAMYVPIDFESKPSFVFWICYSYICFATYFSGMLVPTTILFYNAMAEFLTTEFEILGKSLENVIKGENVKENSARFKEWIKNHQELLK